VAFQYWTALVPQPSVQFSYSNNYGSAPTCKGLELSSRNPKSAEEVASASVIRVYDATFADEATEAPFDAEIDWAHQWIDVIRATRGWIQYGMVGFAIFCIVIGALEALFGR
jgi:hypothetical protein